MYNNELYHFGVKGMKWGKRKKYYNSDGSLNKLGQAKQNYKNKKKSIDAAYTKAGERYDKATKGGKIQSEKANIALDKASDKWAADRKAAKTAYKQEKQRIKENRKSEDFKQADSIKKKHVSEMTNAELRTLNERMNLERNYKNLNRSSIDKGMQYLGTGVALTGSILSLYNNSDKLIKLGKKFLQR